MSECNFTVANTSYLITAINLINEDEILARTLLRLDDETINLLKNLSPEEVRMLGSMNTPLMEIKFDNRILEEFKEAIETKLASSVMKLNDSILLKAS